MSFEDKTDEQMLELYRKNASEMSFYNCAEGESWYRERPLRESCSAEFRKINEELKRRDIPTPQGNYLV
jgi:hypothetical protein